MTEVAKLYKVDGEHSTAKDGNMKNDAPWKEDEISLAEVVSRFRKMLHYLAGRWMVILLLALTCAAAGLAYALLRPVKYVSRVSFVVEDTKATAGGLAALAGQFGFDIGGGGGSIFSAENILLFLKSESLCRETLLTSYDAAGKQTLADKYAAVNGWSSRWLKKKNIGTVSFRQSEEGRFPRMQDSLMQIITKRILKKELSVQKPDKKSSFIEVKAAMRDEMLSKLFVDRLVKIATAHYIDSKTRIKAQNVASLQRRADSLSRLLASRTYRAASTQQTLVDMNPALRMAPVNAEITARDKMMIATIYAEVAKNLELAKMTLSQETPTIQLVDESSLPLKEDKVSKVLAPAAGAALGAFVCAVFLLARRWWRSQPALS